MSRIGNAKIVMIKAGGGGMPADPLPIDHGGTGNTVGYIQTGQRSDETIGSNATAEGTNNSASGNNSHAEGSGTQATKLGAHSEGSMTVASGACAHAQGNMSVASGDNSFVSGLYLNAAYDNQTAVGKNNNNKSTTLFEVGNGTGSNARSNAFEVYSDGKISQDNGSTKFKFGNNGSADGYYDASGTFHAFGSGGASALADLTDANILNPIKHQLLEYDGSKWVNGAVRQTFETQYLVVNSSSWSVSQNSNGYYTYTLTLATPLNQYYAPTIFFNNDLTSVYNAEERRAYDCICGATIDSTTQITLYAKICPTTTFAIYVDGLKSWT